MNHVPKCHIYTSSKYFQEWRCNHSLRSLLQCFTTLLVKNSFLKSNLNWPWHNSKTFPLVPSLVTLEKRPTSFQVVVESNKVSSDLSFLQIKQPHFPQPLLIRLVLQTLHSFAVLWTHYSYSMLFFLCRMQDIPAAGQPDDNSQRSNLGSWLQIQSFNKNNLWIYNAAIIPVFFR